VSLFKDKIEQGWGNSWALIKVRSFCCTRGTHRVTVQLLTFIRAHEFTQPCSILTLNSDTMCAPSAAETSYLYHSTWVHSALFNPAAVGVPIVSLFKDKIEQGWVNSCAVIKVRSFCCTRGTHRVTVQSQDWKRLSELMCSTWVHSALFNLVFEQWHDGCP
jgi:ribosomal protein L30/L7E